MPGLVKLIARKHIKKPVNFNLQDKVMKDVSFKKRHIKKAHNGWYSLQSLSGNIDMNMITMINGCFCMVGSAFEFAILRRISPQKKNNLCGH